MIFSVGRRSFFIATIALWFATTLSAQNDGGWKNAGGDRYGSAAESTANNPFAATAGNQAGAGCQPHAVPATSRPLAAAWHQSVPAQPAPRSPRAAARCPTTRARCGASTTFARTRSASATTARPEQAIVDWILRETGYEAWHSDPVGLLSANREVLRVYHTPEMQAIVADIVDRFVNSSASAYAFTLRVATVRNPNWRAKALSMMTPIPVQTPGVQGWLLAKENARLLVAELSRRTDYREYNSSQQLVNNGQSIVISTMRPRSYIRGALLTQTTWPGYQPEMGTIEEGFSLEFSPLLALDLSIRRRRGEAAAQPD